MARSEPRIGPVLAILAWLLVGAWYVDAVPAWEAPDEPWHLAYSEALVDGHLPDSAATYEYHQPPLYYGWLASALRLLNLAPVARAEDNPYYPFATAALAHPAHDPGAAPLRLARTWSSLLGALTVALTWAVSRRAFPRRPVTAGLAAAVAALLPQHQFIGHSISNDVLAALAGALVIYGLVRWLDQPAQRGGVLVVGTGLALGLVAKLNVMALLPAALVAGLGAWRRGARLGLVLRSLMASLIPPALAAAVLAIRWPTVVENLAQAGTTRAFQAQAELSELAVLALRVRQMHESLFARLGWLNVDVPPVMLGTAGVAAAAALPGLMYLAWRRDRDRWMIAVLGAAWLLAEAAAVRSLMADPQPQGRLLFPALAAGAPLLAAGWLTWAPVGWRGRAAMAMVAGLFLANAYVLAVALPGAYADELTASRPVALRVLAPGWRPSVEVGPATRLRQTFPAEDLSQVELPLQRVMGDGTLRLTLSSPQGTVAESTYRLSELSDGDWVGVSVPPTQTFFGRFSLDLRLVDGDGTVRLWAIPDAAFGEVGLEIDHEPADVNLVMLVTGPLDPD